MNRARLPAVTAVGLVGDVASKVRGSRHRQYAVGSWAVLCRCLQLLNSAHIRASEYTHTSHTLLTSHTSRVSRVKSRNALYA